MPAMLVAIGLLVAAVFGWTTPAAAQPVERIRCESWDYRYQSCPVRDPQYVRLAERIAGRCIEGSDWGVNGRGIYVQNGCRAVFEVTRPSPGFGGGGGFGGQRIVCESWNYQPRSCPANTRGGVRLSRVIAGDCREGQTWSWDRNSVNVRGGCRAEFLVGGGGPGPGAGWGGGGWGGGGGQTVDCNSWNFRPARCPVTVNRDVELIQVYGGECIERRTWFWDRRGIDVRDGCRARFLVR